MAKSICVRTGKVLDVLKAHGVVVDKGPSDPPWSFAVTLTGADGVPETHHLDDTITSPKLLYRWAGKYGIPAHLLFAAT